MPSGIEVEEWASSSGGMSNSEVCVPDTNDEEHYFTSGDIPKLQFRAYWDNEMGMAKVVGKKGSMWTTIRLVRNNKIYCSIEETLYLMFTLLIANLESHLLAIQVSFSA
ncbi:hypothetical protein LOK49_LG01G00510 [Camellia lanceoleosa]|uniref:Uncharacterized protein n=1 Tax=Camellia lanceoleosa TaxID=1840588 RepID=A0ACC0IT69_9ERIC|nr:hypothetical protein LOK49_LG01G00510 [Camellia lanceoleosa]